jgi:hypothetical protein
MPWNKGTGIAQIHHGMKQDRRKHALGCVVVEPHKEDPQWN